ncbi:hypothetical protein ACMFMG_007069 [Clarireedia jacksonii]
MTSTGGIEEHTQQSQASKGTKYVHSEPDISTIENVLSLGPDKPDHMDYDRVDSEVAKYTSDVIVHISEDDNKRLRKLIDKRVLIIMILTYFLQAIDKGTLAFTSIMGIKKDAHLVKQEYAWLTTCIYIAILVIEYPTNWIIQRVPIAKYLGLNVCIWSAVLAMHSMCQNFKSLVVVRTILGIFEASCQPIFGELEHYPSQVDF